MKFVTVILVLTFYCPCKLCTGKFSKDAGGHGYVRWKQLEPDPNITIACDKEWRGKLFVIPGFGLRECEDVGSAINGNKVDIFVSTHEEALKLGTKKARTLEVVEW